MNEVVSIKSLLDMKQIGAHYQGEKPVEFAARVEWYLKSFYNPYTQPEMYLDAYRAAVDYANKSIMLDKLDIDPTDDPEVADPELFKSTMSELVADMPLIKSENGSLSANEMYENLWKKTFDTVKTKARM
jgi:hypothetical protein